MNSFEQKMQTLRARFTESLPARTAAIEIAIRKHREGNRNAVRDLERLLHSLAGTAGTYGLAEMSKSAAQAERICEQWHGPEAIADGTFDSLIAIIGQAAQSPPQLVLAPPPAAARPQTGQRILCVEDDPEQAAYLRTILSEAGYDAATIAHAGAFDDTVKSFHPELILLDINLGADCGLDLARDVRRKEMLAALPIVFVTSQASLESRLHGIRAGGDDYLVKPVVPDLLLATVASRLERARALKSLIDRDEMTGLFTAGAFRRRMQQALDTQKRTGERFCLVMLDIDHFKRVNDQYGHVIGDRVLTSFARLLQAGVRQDDTVGRCGGEEFGILLAGMSQEYAQSLTRRLLDRFAELPHSARRGVRFFVTFSAGVATLASGDDVTSWKQRADDALYAAKRGGRARVAAA